MCSAVNYGRLLLQALLEHWPRTFQPEPGSEPTSDSQALAKPVGNDYFSVPPHTPVIFRCGSDGPLPDVW